MYHSTILRQQGVRKPGPVTRAILIVARWHRRARTRAELARLDENALRDIGLSRSQAEYELGKPFWRP